MKALRRRALAVAVALAATAGLWFGLARSESEDGETPAETTAAEEPIAEAVAGLSTYELADQVLLLGFEGTDATAPVVGEVRTRQLGGILIGPQNWPDAATGTALIAAIRDAGREEGRIPPLIVTSQEGGPYRALPDLPPEQTELELGDGGSPAATARWAQETCAALADAGIDLNLAPVADVATLDSAIADRAFSDDPALAAEMTAAAVRGCIKTGVAPAPLHFPGLGGAAQDTSRGPAPVGLDVATLSARDLEPFRAAFAEGAPAVVLSLALYAAYDPVTPAALSAPIATGLLRDELGFEGVAITDDLGSGAVRNSDPVAKAAVRALAAGADLIQIGSATDQPEVHDAIVEAVASGELEESRLADAAARVIELKQAQGLADLQ